jgi:hypothetical protein
VHDSSIEWSDVSLVQGGPLHAAGRRGGLPAGPRGLSGLGLVLAAIAWIPLAALAAVDGHLTGGSAVPFSHALGSHVRLLVLIPLYFLAEAGFDLRVREVLSALVESHVVPASQRPALAAALRRVCRWSQAAAAEIALILVVLVVAWQGFRGGSLPEVSTWRHDPDGTLTLAGAWYAFAAVPLFQFLTFRWALRLLAWAAVLWRIRGLDLHLTPTHPDRAAGLGGLGVVQVALAPLAFGFSCLFVAGVAERALFAGADVRGQAIQLVAMVVWMAILFVAPHLIFVPKLLGTKQRGLLEYGTLAAHYAHGFDAKWLRDHAPDEALLGAADIQSLADMAGAFDVIREMRIVPIAQHQILLIVGVALAPALPLVFFLIPLDELIRRGLRTVLHLE